MSRTKLRVVLILIVLILVMAAILSGILTYWVGAEGSPASTPQGGEAGQALLAADRTLERPWQPEYPGYLPVQTPFVPGRGFLCQKAET